MTIAIPISSGRSRNMERVKGDATPCVVCGKGIRANKQRYMVHVVNGGGMAALPGEIEDGEPGEMGWFPIGPDCLRSHPELAPYVTTLPRENDESDGATGVPGFGMVSA
jgi:hypothetical protein